MAQKMMGALNPLGFPDTRRAVPEYVGGTADDMRSYFAPANLLSISELKAYLSGYDAKTYTPEMLNIMSVNDMIFAARQIDATNVKGIADYMVKQAVRP